uniref:Enoyl-CoA hydratase n=1 Tax=Panagrolaimus sp. JU765 TaxID=591449 RepID=A0AC34QHW6_9BILA
MPGKDILAKKSGKFWFITFNRPERKNAIAISNYGLILEILKTANDDPETVFTVFTGNGDFFSSGNDFSPESIATATEEGGIGYDKMIASLIDHRKILIGLVNGPAIGVACTMLALFDYVVASEKAYFLCPFTAFGLNPEGTSSLSFQTIMGYPQAARLALFAEKITAEEAFRIGYISKVMSHKEFTTGTQEILKNFDKLAPQSLLASKELMRGQEWRKKMHEINEKEKAALNERFSSEETLERIMKRFGSKI